MYSVQVSYVQGVMEYKGHCLEEWGRDLMINKGKDIYSKTWLLHMYNGNIVLGNKKSCLHEFGLISKR